MEMNKPSIFNFSAIESAIDYNPNVLTLFSGGLDSSYLLYRLQKYGCKTIALSVDVGESEPPEKLAKIAAHFGAEFVHLDAREAFVKKAVLPAIKAQARYLGHFPISSSLSRPIMAEAAVKLAQERGCGCLLHTANTSQNSLRRLNGAISNLNYFGSFGSPYELDVTSREEKTHAMCRASSLAFDQRIRSGDANLWCREFESGDLDNPESVSLKESMYSWTRHKKHASEDIEITFEAGVPTALDQVPLAPITLIDQLNSLAGSHGIGRFEGLEHLAGGEKVFEVREAPAAHVLMLAYFHLCTSIIDFEAQREKQGLDQIWVREAVEGRWFSQLKYASEAFIDNISKEVTGCVRFTLRNGDLSLSGIQAANPKYLTNRDLWEANKAASHKKSQTLQPSLESA